MTKFYVEVLDKNEAVTLAKLQEPLIAAAREGIIESSRDYALCVHDWSRLSYKARQQSRYLCSPACNRYWL